jgi:hypothetical protein
MGLSKFQTREEDASTNSGFQCLLNTSFTFVFLLTEFFMRNCSSARCVSAFIIYRDVKLYV